LEEWTRLKEQTMALTLAARSIVAPSITGDHEDGHLAQLSHRLLSSTLTVSSNTEQDKDSVETKMEEHCARLRKSGLSLVKQFCQSSSTIVIDSPKTEDVEEEETLVPLHLIAKPAESIARNLPLASSALQSHELLLTVSIYSAPGLTQFHALRVFVPSTIMISGKSKKFPLPKKKQTKKTRTTVKTQTFEVLASSRLTALKDRIVCPLESLLPRIIDDQEPLNKSSFFLIGDQRCNDQTWTNLPDLQLGRPYLYCHIAQGCGCTHLLTIDMIRQQTPYDLSQSLEATGQLAVRETYRFRRRRRRCRLCDHKPASLFSVNDPLAPDNPCFFCKDCYSTLHPGKDEPNRYRYNLLPLFTD